MYIPPYRLLSLALFLLRTSRLMLIYLNLNILELCFLKPKYCIHISPVHTVLLSLIVLNKIELTMIFQKLYI